MNLLTDAKKMETRSSETPRDAAVLPPYQIRKLASMVVLACYERDLLGRLQDDRTKGLEGIDFLLRSQLQYRFQEDAGAASVEIQVTDVDD